MARQPASKYQPTRFGRQVPDQWEADADEPANDPQGFSERGLSFIDVQLTNAQVLALLATPVNVLAAPGANRIIVVDRVYIVADSAAGAFTTEADDIIALEYTGGTNVLTFSANGFFNAGAIERRTVAPAEALSGTLPVNEGLRLINEAPDEITGGNAANTVSFRIWYHVVDAVAFS